jgi:hypothetical protein
MHTSGENQLVLNNTLSTTEALMEAVKELGTANWGEIARRMPTKRSSIQCRRRYTNKVKKN